MSEDRIPGYVGLLPPRRPARALLTLLAIFVGLGGIACIGAVPFMGVLAAPIAFFAGIVLLICAMAMVFRYSGQTVTLATSRYGETLSNVYISPDPPRPPGDP